MRLQWDAEYISNPPSHPEVTSMFDRRTAAEKRSYEVSKVSIRRVDTDETGTLTAVAARDSQRLPAGPWFVAEVDGTPLAVLSLSTGSFVADPFSFTVGLRNLLEFRAGQVEAAHTQSRVRLLGRRGLRALRV
jgi:hypothetical protein